MCVCVLLLLILKWIAIILFKRKVHGVAGMVASPWGVSVSAQAADLHSPLGVYQNRHSFRALGSVDVSPEGYVWWEGPFGRVSLCQSRDNILIALNIRNSPGTPIVQMVCNFLRDGCDLPRHARPRDPCPLKCHTSRTALGFTLVRGPQGTDRPGLSPPRCPFQTVRD